ncbi:MAG TPA: hypothetical protein IAA57_10280 [Candidatus Pullilachnospira intestinigallinarum]|nr:hypothetical protein [Candidatus Pullilachnospira intestinigallinarum]
MIQEILPSPDSTPQIHIFSGTPDPEDRLLPEILEGNQKKFTSQIQKKGITGNEL